MKIDIDKVTISKIKIVLASSSENIIDMAIEIGEDVFSFFEGGDWSDLDLRECELDGVSFSGSILDGAILYEDQLPIIKKTNPRSINRVIVHKRQYTQAISSFGPSIDEDANTEQIEASLNDFRPKIIEAGSFQKAMEVLAAMAGSNIPPDDNIFNTVAALAKTYPDIVALLDFCRAHGYRISYQVLSQALSLTGSLDDAAAIFKDMRERGFLPTTDNLLHFIREADNIFLGEERLDFFQANGVILTYPALLAVVQLSAVAQRWRDVLQRFATEGVRPKIDVFHKLLSQVESVSVAREILLTMWHGGVPAKNDTYVAILGIASKYSDAVEFFDEMLEKGIRPNIHIFRNLLRAASSPEEVIDAARRIKILNFVLSELDLHIIVEGISGQKRDSYLREMATIDRVIPYSKL